MLERMELWIELRERAAVRVAAPAAMRRGGALVLALVVAGCGASAAPSRHRVRFRLGFETLHGYVYSSGERGVVLANQANAGQSEWTAFARLLAARGYRVLTFDYGGAPPEEEVTAAAAALRRTGATRYVLIGASEGAKAAVAAAASNPRGAVGVVALSAERYAQRGAQADVLPSARRLTLPALFVTARHDPLAAVDTPLLERAAASHDKRLLVVSGSAHGVALLRRPSVRSAILAFLAARWR